MLHTPLWPVCLVENVAFMRPAHQIFGEKDWESLSFSILVVTCSWSDGCKARPIRQSQHNRVWVITRQYWIDIVGVHVIETNR